MRFRFAAWIVLGLIAIIAATAIIIHHHNEQVVDQRLGAAFPGDSKAILDHASQIELYSLCPMTDPCMEDITMKGKSKGKFHDVEVLGKTVVTGSRKTALLSALYHGIAYNDQNNAACFNPRHAIHCVQGKQTIDVVICFQCQNVRIYVNGHRDEYHGDVVISREQKAVFNRTLNESGITVSIP